MTDEPTEVAVGETYMVHPGGSHRQTLEVVGLTDDEATLEVVDKAVGYDYGERYTVDRATLEQSIEGDVITASFVKVAPDWDVRLAP